MCLNKGAIMRDEYDFKKLMIHMSNSEAIEEVSLGSYTVSYVLVAEKKSRMEYFIFDLDDVKDVSDEEIKKLVKSSPKFKSGVSISRKEKEGCLYVKFNRFSYYDNLDMFNKTFLNTTKDVVIQRYFYEGKGFHQNPKFYKNIWWIFHNGVKSNNLEELIKTDENRFLDSFKVDAFIDKLREKNEPYAVMSKSYPRLGVKIFDYERMKKKDPEIEFAPALEDDADREEILAMYEKIREKNSEIKI